MFGGFPFGGMPGGGGGFPGAGGPSGPVNNTKYYEALGVTKDSSDAEIKKAYRKMATKHHPDKGGDPDFFKTINEAYDVLKDPKKKEIYDTHGEEVLKEGGGGAGMGGGGMGDLFDMLNGGGRRRPQGPRKAEDTVHKLTVPLKDFYMGTTKRMQLRRPVKCDTCAGTGSKSQSMTNCTRCRGSGVETQIRQIGPGMMTQVQGRCSGCSGRGKSIKPGDQCGTCRGGGVRDEQKRFDVELDKGAPDGHKVVFRGESGTDDSSKEPGDLIFVFSEAKDEEADWQRQGNDLLLMDYAVSLKQALCGHEIHLRHLDGRVVKLQRDAGVAIKPGDFVRVIDEGMPLHGRPFSKGNLYVRFSVNMPSKLSAGAITQLEALLPDEGASKFMDTDDAEEVQQSSVGGIDKLRGELQSRMRQYKQQQSSAYDSDEDEGMGGQRVQCAQQ